MPHILFSQSDCQMPRAVTEIRSLARSHTRKAVNVLVGVMGSRGAKPAARVAAANAILDRGWGKATQPIEGGGNDGALELIHRIGRVIGRTHLLAQIHWVRVSRRAAAFFDGCVFWPYSGLPAHAIKIVEQGVLVEGWK
jgi:hypothetical protein